MAETTQKTAEEVIKELDAKIVAQNKTIAEKDGIIATRDKSLEEANKAIVELTEQLNQKKDVQSGASIVSIKGKKYPLLLAEFNYQKRVIKYEDLVADEKLALELLTLNAGVFGEAL